MSAAMDKDSDFAAAQGYTRERVADRGKSVVPRVFYDASTEANAFSLTLDAPAQQADPEPYVVHGFDLDRRYEPGGAPIRVTSDKQRKYENGLVERRHQSVKLRAIAMLAGAGLGFKAYRYAYEYAANTESLLATSIPSNYRAEDGTLKAADARGIPFVKALGFPYDYKARPLYAFGSLAFPRVDMHRLGAFRHVREAGLFLGREAYVSRRLFLAVHDIKKGLTTTPWTPETTIIEDKYHTLTPIQKRDFLLAQRATEPAETDVRPGDMRELRRILSSPPKTQHWPYQASSGSDDTSDDSDSDQERGAPRIPGGTARAHPAIATSGPETVDLDVALATPALRAMAIRPHVEGTVVRTLAEVPKEEVIRAFQAECENLRKHKVLEPIYEPMRDAHGKPVRPLSVKIFAKVQNDSTVKTRMVARGYLQRENIDYYSTYSPVASPPAIRQVVATAASLGLPLQTLDVEAAYLQSEMEEDVYIRLPKEIEEPLIAGMSAAGGPLMPHEADPPEGSAGARVAPREKPLYWKLKRSLYGCRQSGKNWRTKSDAALRKCGFTPSPNNDCLYFSHDAAGEPNCVIAVVVDDILGAATDEKWREVTDALTKHGIILDAQSVGRAREFNGMQIERHGEHHYRLLQREYVEKTARDYAEKHGWRPKQHGTTMPLGPTGESALVKCEKPKEGSVEHLFDTQLDLDPEARAAFNLRYASLLGSLGWLANSTRPDIAFAASAAGRHTKAPYSRHLKALEHVLNYVIHTSDKGLVYDSSNCRFQMRLSAFSDADFATDEETRLSRTGAILFINNGPVYWTSHLQKVVSISTTASELLAAHEAMQQVRIIGENLEAQGFHSKYTPLMIDNTIAIQTIMDDRSGAPAGAKHLGARIKQLAEARGAKSKDIWPVYCNTNSQAADLFTKGYLSGSDVATRFASLERRVRGETSSPKWIDDIVAGSRPKNNKGFPVPAIEIQPPMVNLKTYLKLSGRHLTYEPGHRKAPLTKEVRALAAKLGAQAELGGRRGAALYADVRALAAKLGARVTSNGRYILPRKVNIMELFCGENHSAVRAILELCDNPELMKLVRVDLAETLDNNPACSPSILADITKWDPIKAGYKPGQFQFIWCSIPCTEYSRAKTGARNLELADKVGRAAVRTIFKLKPDVFVIENPTGLLRDRPFMRCLRKFLKSTTYCMFSGFKYRKETDIYTNVDVPLKHCRTTPCREKRLTGKHPETAQRGPSKNGTPGNTLATLHRVPHELVQLIFKYAFLPETITVSKYLPDDLEAKEAIQVRAALATLEAN